MIYKAKEPIDIERAKQRFNWLIDHGKTFELKEKKPIRSISQNSYLHLVLTWFAYEYGETIDYTKQVIFKVWVNSDLFKTERANPKTGEVREHLKSTSDLNTKEMTIAIDRFRNYASKEAGIYLPEPKDMGLINDLQNQVNNIDKTYL